MTTAANAMLCSVALAQLMESLARLVLATSRMQDAEQIERLVLAVDRLAYRTEHEVSED
jgi:hypothetical protein